MDWGAKSGNWSARGSGPPGKVETDDDMDGEYGSKPLRLTSAYGAVVSGSSVGLDAPAISKLKFDRTASTASSPTG